MYMIIGIFISFILADIYDHPGTTFIFPKRFYLHDSNKFNSNREVWWICESNIIIIRNTNIKL